MKTLPTDLYATIRVTKSPDPDLLGQVLHYDGVGYWSNSGHTLGPASTARRITEFEILAPGVGSKKRPNTKDWLIASIGAAVFGYCLALIVTGWHA